MKKIVTEIRALANGNVYPRIFCTNEDGSENEAISLTLCDAVWELNGRPIIELDKLFRAALAGTYSEIHPQGADMSINEKLIWVRPPWAGIGRICISNENLPSLSIDGGAPSVFTYDQFYLAVRMASELSTMIAKNGLGNLVGYRQEVAFPD